MPIAIRTMPPMIVALFPNFMPKCRPMISATMQHSAVVKPIRVAADAMLSESAAKLTPTASASMLVAIAWKNKTGIVSFFGLFMECIPEHLAADEPEDNERDDARIGFDEGPHQRTSIEPDHGHEPLKDTEEDGHQETVGFIGSAIDEGVGHRYRKSVHGKGKSQNEKFDRAHGLVLPQFSMHDLFMTAQINRSSESIDFGCHMYRFIDIIYE